VKYDLAIKPHGLATSVGTKFFLLIEVVISGARSEFNTIGSHNALTSGSVYSNPSSYFKLRDL